MTPDTWKPGDKVRCIRDGCIRDDGNAGLLQIDHIYEIIKIYKYSYNNNNNAWYVNLNINTHPSAGFIWSRFELVTSTKLSTTTAPTPNKPKPDIMSITREFVGNRSIWT